MSMSDQYSSENCQNGKVVSYLERCDMETENGDEVVLRIEDDERISALKRRIERAQRFVQQHVKPGTSLVDELIAERRKAAGSE